MKSMDLVRPDLTLTSFHYEQKLDEEPLIIDGRIAHSEFLATLCRGTHKKILKRSLSKPLYPSSLINLYPVLNGLEIGDEYNYQIFDPQVQAFLPVLQTVVSFEESPRLYIEPSFKVHTRVREHEVDSWINLRGETVFELAMGGVLITYKETEEAAKRYLSEASLNKKDLILDFSLVPTKIPIPCPRNATYLEIILEGIADRLPLLQGPGQGVSESRTDGRKIVIYRLQSHTRTIPLQPAEKAHSDRFLFPSFRIESDHPEIKRTAAHALGDAVTPLERVKQLADWVSEAVEDEPVESFSALEVLRRRKGECQAHTLLYTALARASGIPTRLVGGLVYMEGMGFLYHGWAESYVDGWISVDPTFNQVGVDATHIKLVEGDSWMALLHLGKVVGRVKAKVIRLESSCR
jgi:transglutaminase-like putative cysteine protease